MMDFIMVPAVMTIITLGIYKLFELFVCKKERIMLIEKMDERGLLPQMDTPKLRGSSFSFSALKIGCLLAGMGLGLLLGYLICYATIPNYFTALPGSSDSPDSASRVPFFYLYGRTIDYC